MLFEARTALRPWVVGRLAQACLTEVQAGRQAMAWARRVPAAVVRCAPPWEAERAGLKQLAGATVAEGWRLDRST